MLRVFFFGLLQVLGGGMRTKKKGDVAMRGVSAGHRRSLLLSILGILLVLLISSCGGADGDGADAVDASCRHVLLITLDTTRQDRLGIYGHRVGGVSPTPAIDAIAREGRAFSQAFASTPLTLPSHATMLTGLEPPEHGIRENNDFVLAPAAGRSFRTLAEVLHEHGYRTAAFVSARVMAREFGLDAGFEVYDDVAEQGLKGVSHYEERPADETTNHALKWLKDLNDSRSFVWVHYFDPHHPWQKHAGRAGQVAARGDAYDGEIAFVDDQVGRLVAALKEKGIWEDTLVVIAGDHGEGLGEHGEDSHGFLLHGATMRIPLIVKPAGGWQLHPRRSLARTVDLFDTVLDFCSVKSPAGGLGISLTRQEGDNAVAYGETVYPFRQFGWAALWSIRQDPWVLIEGGGERLLFNRRDDPAELKNLTAAESQRAQKMSSRLLALRRRLKSRVATDSRRRDDGVRASAYVGGPSRDVPVEPGVDENNALPYPGEKMAALRALNNLIAALEKLGRGGASAENQEVFVSAETAMDVLRRTAAGSPAIRFWLGRAQWKMGTHVLAQQLGRDVQQHMLQQAREDLSLYLRQRVLDHRAWNMRLAVELAMFGITDDKAHLEIMKKDASEQIGRGLANGLTHNLLGQALWRLGEGEKALKHLELSVELAPKNVSFRRDRDRARRALSSR